MTEQRELRTVNDIREAALVRHFQKNKGKKAFILTEAFPFMFIGKIKEVVGDVLVLKVQTTSVPALEDKEWSIHIDAIEVFYVETGIGAKIPDLKDE